MLEAWDAAGNKIFDHTSQVVKFLGSMTIPPGTTAGFITDPRFTAYAMHVPFVARADGYQPDPQYDAVVWISGNNLHWSWPSPSMRPTQNVIYGIK